MADTLVNIVTPVGKLNWVNIHGQGKLNYNEDGYNYVATIHLSGDKAEQVKAKIDEVLGEVPKGKTVKSLGYRKMFADAEGNLRSKDKNGKIIVDDEDVTDNYEETDILAFTFSTRTTFRDGKTKKINVYNAGSKTGKPQKVELGERKIGNDSEGAISGKLQRFEKGKEIGVSLFLNAIQLTKFNEYEGGAGFEAQEGDFEDVGEDDGFTSPASEQEEQPAKAAKKPVKL